MIYSSVGEEERFELGRIKLFLLDWQERVEYASRECDGVAEHFPQVWRRILLYCSAVGNRELYKWPVVTKIIDQPYP